MMLNQSRTLCSNMAVLLFFRNHPRWGASNIPLLRQVPAEYQDGISRPKGWDRSKRQCQRTFTATGIFTFE